MDRQIDVCLCVCVCFQVLARLGGCSNSSKIKRIGPGGWLRRIYPIYSPWGAERIRLQYADGSVDRCNQ